MVHTLVLNGQVFLKVGSDTALTLIRLNTQQAERLVHELLVSLQEQDYIEEGACR